MENEKIEEFRRYFESKLTCGKYRLRNDEGFYEDVDVEETWQDWLNWFKTNVLQ